MAQDAVQLLKHYHETHSKFLLVFFFPSSQMQKSLIHSYKGLSSQRRSSTQVLQGLTASHINVFLLAFLPI